MSLSSMDLFQRMTGKRSRHLQEHGNSDEKYKVVLCAFSPEYYMQFKYEQRTGDVHFVSKCCSIICRCCTCKWNLYKTFVNDLNVTAEIVKHRSRTKRPNQQISNKLFQHVILVALGSVAPPVRYYHLSLNLSLPGIVCRMLALNSFQEVCSVPPLNTLQRNPQPRKDRFR